MNMIKPRIVVTGATGKTGSVVVTELLKAGYPVRALVHREDSRNAPPSNEDIARVAVAALMDPARHAGKSYRPTGPELLGAEEWPRPSAEPSDDQLRSCQRRPGCS